MGLFDLNFKEDVKETKRELQEYRKKQMSIKEHYEIDREEAVYEHMDKLDTVGRITNRVYGEDHDEKFKHRIYRVMENLRDQGKLDRLDTSSAEPNVYRKI